MREQQTFLLGDGVTDGCIATCEENKLLETIDPSNDCAGTIEKLKGFYEPFKDVCELGIAAGAGGGGGTGGAAGVGGAGGAGGGA